jgi:hypothetical protein
MELVKPHDDGFAGADCIVEADDPPRVLDTIQRWAVLRKNLRRTEGARVSVQMATASLVVAPENTSRCKFYLPNAFPTQECAIEAAIQAGQRKIDVSCGDRES